MIFSSVHTPVLQQLKRFRSDMKVVSVWNQDGGTSSQQAYKSVPFYLSSRGYGVFINHPGEVELEIGVEKASRVGISVPGQQLQYYIIYGPSPLEASLSQPCFLRRFGSKQGGFRSSKNTPSSRDVLRCLRRGRLVFGSRLRSSRITMPRRSLISWRV